MSSIMESLEKIMGLGDELVKEKQAAEEKMQKDLAFALKHSGNCSLVESKYLPDDWDQEDQRPLQYTDEPEYIIMTRSFYEQQCKREEPCRAEPKYDEKESEEPAAKRKKSNKEGEGGSL